MLGICAPLATSPGCASKPRRDPDQSQIRYQLGVEYFNSRRVEAAIEELQEALRADPDNADAHNMLGLIALSQGHDYVAQLETGACLKGADAEAVRGDALTKFREAEEHLRRAVTLHPTLAPAWNNLSVALLQLQDWDGAIDAAQRALQQITYVQPEVARANLGWAYFQKKEVQRAWKELHEAVSRSPGFCVGRYRLAKIYVERNEIGEAATTLAPVLANKNCPIQEAFLLAGLIEGRRKAWDQARAHYETCERMAPRSCLADECRRYARVLSEEKPN